MEQPRKYEQLGPEDRVVIASLRLQGKGVREDAIFIWAELHDGRLSGVTLNNVKRPGMPYGPDQPRSSAVSSQCRNLAVGNRAYYLRCDSLGALERFAKWYGTT